MRTLGSSLVLGLWLSTGGLAAEGPDVGEPAPEFVLKDAKGSTVRLSDFRGEKAVVLEFFRSGSW